MIIETKNEFLLNIHIEYDKLLVNEFGNILLDINKVYSILSIIEDEKDKTSNENFNNFSPRKIRNFIKQYEEKQSDLHILNVTEGSIKLKIAMGIAGILMLNLFNSVIQSPNMVNKSIHQVIHTPIQDHLFNELSRTTKRFFDKLETSNNIIGLQAQITGNNNIQPFYYRRKEEEGEIIDIDIE